MILAAYRDPNGDVQGGLYDTYEQYHKETFSPECEEIGLIEFKVSGKSYKECKANAEDIAIKTQSLMTEMSLFCGEILWISSWFEVIGKRYGLLQEFKENGIC